MIKTEHFEYSVVKLIEWSCLSNQKTLLEFNGQNDFSKLKVLKLHFFLCAIDANKNSLLDLFNTFYAMPYGHVESDLYDDINAGRLKRFDFMENTLIIKPEYINDLPNTFPDLGDSLHKIEIDNAIESLKRENIDLINYTALELVDLSHLWTSWRITFSLARADQKFSQKIPSDVIRSESKFFKIAL